jgi:hypothetical protein
MKQRDLEMIAWLANQQEQPKRERRDYRWIFWAVIISGVAWLIPWEKLAKWLGLF